MTQYTVKPNDTLFLIAKQYDIPLAVLIKANPQISDPNMINIGQTINIPSLPAVPSQIGVIESGAVNIINDVFTKDWDNAAGKVKEITTAMNQVAPALRDAKVPDRVIDGLNTTISSLGQFITQKKPYHAISMANRITFLLADALDYFASVVPADVIRMAYFARQIIVNVEQNDWAEAYQNYRRANTVWQGLRMGLEARYSQDVAAIDKVMDDLHASIDKKDYRSAINNAGKLLALVSTIAANFQRQNSQK